MREYLGTFIKNVRCNDILCLIPERKGLRKMIEKHTFHHHAEIFLQISGITEFSFPFQSINLKPYQILIVPPELPHAEIVIKKKGDFETLVITPAQNSMSCHLSREYKFGIPDIFYNENVKTMETVQVQQYTESLIETGNPKDVYGKVISNSLLLALLATVRRSLIEIPISEPEHSKISEVKNAVLSRLHQNNLSVKQLAVQLNCSSDYLSWLFHRETGNTLNRYINQLRLKKAVDYLEHTDYTISEIAWLCGYKTPAYFSRVFSSNFSKSPRSYRHK